jgi:alcohol dehydrogenase class IV
MLPRVAIVDSALTRDLPASLTAATGLDALTQLIEPYVSIRANAMTDVLAVDGMRLAATALPRAWRDGGDRTARDDMAMASLLGGMALANAGLGAVHGLAAAIGGRFHAPHGAVCAALLPYVFAANARALANRDRDSNAVRLARFDDVARIVTGRPTATATDGAEWLHALIRELGIPPLRTYGITPVHVSDLVAASRRASSMKGNPVELSEAELTRILMEEGDRS